MFALFKELGSPIYPDDFKDVEVKDEPLEPDTVSCEHRIQSVVVNINDNNIIIRN